MRIVPVTIDTHLRFPSSAVDIETAELLLQTLDIRNPENPLEDHINLASIDANQNVVLPRGFAVKLARGLSYYGYQIEWIDNRSIVWANIPLPTRSIDFIDYQNEAIWKMGRTEQGIYEAPPSAGKTITSALFISAARQRTIIIVDKINLATQWKNRIEQALGYECGIIGDNSWVERDITVTTRQTIWSKRKYLDQIGWWRYFGLVIIDECHAVSAESVRELIQKFPAYFRIGLSATPDRRNWLELVSRSVIGEVFCRTTDEQLERAGRLIRPRVVAVRTPFEFRWNRKANMKSEWQRMLRILKFDIRRNRLIAKYMAEQRGRSSLVATEHTGHAHELAAHALSVGWPNDRVHMLTGAQKDEERQQVIQYAMDGDCIVFSTIGKEALDIPRLDRLFLPFPGRLEYASKQVIGRLKRPFANKDYPIVYDFWDYNVPRLANQFTARRGTYERERLEIIFL